MGREGVKLRAERLWVDPEFAKSIKVNARLEGMKIVDYTKKLNEGFEDLAKRKIEVDRKIRGNKYEFKF